MAKTKITRSLQAVGEAQTEVEENHADKFEDTKILAEKKQLGKSGRNYPQVSCTISPEDKKIMDSLALYASNKTGRIVKPSEVLRAMLRLCSKNRDGLSFE